MSDNQNVFDALYPQLEPALTELEENRKKLKVAGSKNGLIGAAIVLIGSLFFLPQLQAQAYFLLVPLAIAVWVFCVNSKASEFSRFYKNTIIQKIVLAICSNADYKPYQGIPESMFSVSGLFASPDRYSSEDMISGKVDKTDFVFSEVHAQERRVSYDGKGRRQEYWTDIFKGFLFIADFHKKFSGHTVVRNDSFFKFGFGSGRVKLESPEFESRFDTYSTDEIEARYILTPSMMERLIALDKKFDKSVQFSYVNSSVFVAIPENRNHFEAGIWKPVTRDKVEEEFSLLCTLLSIINDMNLNMRIWTKE